MKIESLRTGVGIFFIIVHFAALLYVVLVVRNSLSTSETLEVVLLLSPLFSVYTTAIVKKFLADPHSRTRGRVASGRYIFVVLFFPGVFAFAIFAILYQYKAGPIATVADLRQYLAACETVAGCYLGLVMGNMFDAPQTSPAQ
jgi:hypothetical protein